tara:strand:+ start:289 stop:2061 length:1773 start_codon:yes stop_codon:yes gene_type:complete
MRPLTASLIAALSLGLTLSTAAAEPVSYQGAFTDNGQAPAGTFDVRFTVYSASVGGIQVGSQLTRVVTLDASDGGVFSFDDLDFGPDVFTGPARWFEIAIRPSGGSYTVLSPRQRVNPTPYSIFAQSSGTGMTQAYLNGRSLNNTGNFPLEITGSLDVGTPTNNGALRVLQAGSATPVIQLFNLASHGGSLRMRDEAGADIVRLEADPQGTGAGLFLAANGGSMTFDADLGGGPSSGSRMTWTGPSSTLAYDTAIPGAGGRMTLTGPVSSLTLSSGGPSVGGRLGLTGPFAELSFDATTGGISTGGRFRVTGPLGEMLFDTAPDGTGLGARLRVTGPLSELEFATAPAGINSGAQLSISGPMSGLTLDTGLTGNDALVLPAASVGPDELFAAPGIASIFRSTGASITTSISTVTSRSLTVPAPGYVVVLATANVGFTRLTNADGFVIMAVSDVNNQLPGTSRTLVRMPRSGLTSGQYDFPGTSHAVFEVPAAGQYTYYFNAQAIGFSGTTISNANLTLFYIPKTYGTVSPTDFELGTPSGTDYAPARPLTNEQILTEQLAEQQRALAELRAEQALLRRQLDAMRARSSDR